MFQVPSCIHAQKVVTSKSKNISQILLSAIASYPLSKVSALKIQSTATHCHFGLMQLWLCQVPPDSIAVSLFVNPRTAMLSRFPKLLKSDFKGSPTYFYTTET